jgi:molybdopterin synthase catalytic subunit
MTEKSLRSIASSSKRTLESANCHHYSPYWRVKVNEQIVLVVTTSEHRQEAFESCHFIIDYLKQMRPFGKRNPPTRKKDG